VSHDAGLWNGGGLLRTKLAHVFAVWSSSAVLLHFPRVVARIFDYGGAARAPFLYALANSKRSSAPLASTACKAKPGLFTFCRVCSRSAPGNLMKVYLLGS
jgi:hypothetical protein